MENWGRDPWWLFHPWRQGRQLANSLSIGECTSLEWTWTAMGTHTQDCPGCAAAQSNQRPRMHSEGCRARLEEAMPQDELGRDKLLRAALRRAEPTDAVPEEQGADMGQTHLDPAPERPSAAGFIRREDKRVLRPVEPDQTKSGKARLNFGQGEKRPGGEREDEAHPAADSSAAGMNRGKPKRKPVGAMLLRRLQAAEAAAEGSVCAIEIVLAMEAADRLCADAVALAEAYSPERFKPRAGAFGLRAGLALDLRTGWDLSVPKQQEEARVATRHEKPTFWYYRLSVWRSARCRISTRGLRTTRPSWQTAACILSMLAAWRRSR